MFTELKQQVYEANMLLPKNNLVTLTWGNVSQIDKTRQYIAIKPSGVSYDNMKVSDIVVVDMEGKVVDGDLKPSSDTDTHLRIYQEFSQVGGVVHTHSRWATIYAQAQLAIPALGTTHADYFYGDVPCTRLLSPTEISGQYEKETGNLIIETMYEKELDPSKMPAIIVASHGPFTFGSDAIDAVHHAIILEEVAFMAYHARYLNSNVNIQAELLDKHYLRKHGKDAYYGQS